MPKVSIIMAAYNGEKHIAEAINSLLGQTFKDFEIIIIDDGSTDKTAEIIKSFDDDRIKYFYKENSGLPAIPRNFGIKEAAGEYIAFCDHDDIWYPEKLEKQLALDIDDKVGLIITSADIIDDEGKKIGVRKVPDNFINSQESFEMLLNEDFITACSALIPKKIIEKAGYLNEGLKGNDDYDLWLRITRDYGIFGIEEPLCAWRRTGTAYSGEMSKIFLENEKIFGNLKGRTSDESKFIERGKNNNLTRLFIALIKESKDEEVRKILSKINWSDQSFKTKCVANVFKLSPILARKSILTFNRVKQ